MFRQILIIFLIYSAIAAASPAKTKTRRTSDLESKPIKIKTEGESRIIPGIKGSFLAAKAALAKISKIVSYMKFLKVMLKPFRLLILFLKPEIEAFLCLLKYYKLSYPDLRIPYAPEASGLFDIVFYNLSEWLKPYVAPVLFPRTAEMDTTNTTEDENTMSGIFDFISSIGQDSNNLNMATQPIYDNSNQSYWIQPSVSSSMTQMGRSKRSLIPFHVLVANYPKLALSKCAALYAVTSFWRWIEF